MSSAPDYGPGRGLSLIDELLAEQQELSAVESFARRHEEGDILAAARVYEDRIPVGRAPLPGQQLAFRVDLDACTGCKACVTACHSLNGLAPDETWRDVGLVVGGREGAAVQHTVTTTCHHCEDPACLAGCPVLAYEKDPVTGIVRHLDDQCIGCQYCVLKCPYDVPKYNADLGIVRKCDMCAGRLAEGEAPACVQGCPNGAISIEIVDTAGEGPAFELLPGSSGAIPDSSYTRPTTRYVSQVPTARLKPANLDYLAPSQAHDPLAVMLVLMQLSVGALLFSGLGRLGGLVLAAASALLGLGAATFHLGRPLYAFRAFLGWRTSWMSREIIVFGAYAPAIVFSAAASVLVQIDAFPSWGPPWTVNPVAALLPVLRSVALGLGLLGAVCSAMIYVDTHRPLWALCRTGPMFAGTLLGLGGVGTAAATALEGWILDAGRPLLDVAGPMAIGSIVLALKVGAEAWGLVRRSNDESVALGRTSRLLRGPLLSLVRFRFGFAALGLLAATCVLIADLGGGWVAAISIGSFALLVLGELLERHLYFRAESSPGMPGQ